MTREEQALHKVVELKVKIEQVRSMLADHPLPKQLLAEVSAELPQVVINLIKPRRKK